MNITGTVVMNARAISSGMIDLVSSNKWEVTTHGDKQTTLKPNAGKFNAYGIHLKNGLLSCSNVLDNISSTEDGTVTMWIYLNDKSKDDLYTSQPNGEYYSYSLMLFCNNSGTGFCSSGYPIAYSNSKEMVSGEWHYVSFTRSNGTSYFFLDGKLLWNGSFGYPIVKGNHVVTDHSSRYTVDAVYDDIVIIKGQALWTADYTLPTDYITGSTITAHSTPLYYDNTGAVISSYYLKQY